ncbi:MAG TPA: hypothetical protein VMU12_02650, partial [Candidatus Paceibacterota bacterium]|nr:hypothetical protein [Candidatus Paceibacterota bacterium]
MTSREASDSAEKSTYPIQYRIKESRVIDGIEYLSLSDVSTGTPYSQEYLSLLSRKGILDARKIGRNWYVTRAAFNDYVASRAKKNISSVLGLIGSSPAPATPVASSLTAPMITNTAPAPVQMPSQPMPVFITLPAPVTPTLSQPKRMRLLYRVLIMAGVIIVLIGLGFWLNRTVKDAVQNFFDRTTALVQQMQNQKPVQNITVIQQVPGTTPAAPQKVIVEREVPVFYPGPLAQTPSQLNPQTGTPVTPIINVSGQSYATLDSAVANGNSTNHLAFFNGGLYGGTGSFQSLGVNRDASFGSLDDQSNVNFTVNSKQLALDTSGNATFTGSVTAQNADFSGVVSAAATFGSGLEQCDGSEFLQYVSSSGTFSCATASGGTGGTSSGLETREAGSFKATGIATLSFDPNSFDLSASASNDTVVKLDYINGPASRAMSNTFTAASNQFSNTLEVGTASVSSSLRLGPVGAASETLEVSGTASISGNVTVAGNITSPVSGFTQSEKFGAGATVGGSQSVAIGYGSTVNSYAAALGWSAKAGFDSVSFGVGASTSTAGIAIGASTNTIGANATAIGFGAAASGAYSVALGSAART